jgi:hypothetical protein
MDSEQAAEDSEFSFQSISRWLNANGFYLAPKESPGPVIHIHIDKMILANDKSIIGQVGELIMGDRFEKIGSGATIVNRSALINSVNKTKEAVGGDVAHALERLAVIVEQSGNPDAVENLNALSEELERAQPRKALLRSFWNGITAALPGLVEIANLADHISRLFA